MTTAVAAPPVPAPHAPPSVDGVGSSRTYATIAPSTSSPRAAVTPNSKSTSRLAAAPPASAPASASAPSAIAENASPTSSSDSSAQHQQLQQRPDGKRSPLSYVF
ncbi:hypothetical protein BU24DRAFT_462824 [Aaosphaeria arxii CBS 175.79]|uniref:Uncharacterized protein n=1 Tax=Aaosphaeria arxii CBS 175.79 TaxID=1450172 RepID=A0A6A5XTQ9_9PLEO|nr:uncharacterized protein BU24DRAFT_462824 [Aaosphaeria arxii CBS 175.79]KAF2016698.1 hypothetical protein BU24DRAFT_462824 [Aaosphaeria arxii CBS 175.79]